MFGSDEKPSPEPANEEVERDPKKSKGAGRQHDVQRSPEDQRGKPDPKQHLTPRRK